MGDLNNDLNKGNEPDNSQFMPRDQEYGDANSADSGNQSFENETEQSTFEEPFYEHSFVITPDGSSDRKPKLKLIAAIAIIAVLLAGSVLALANRTLSNTFALLTKSPVEYYSAIEKQNINKGIDSLTASYDKYLDLYQKNKTSGIAQDTNLKLTVNPQFTSLIGLEDFQSVEAKIHSLSKENNGKSAISIFYNEQSLVTVNTLLNSESGELFANIPELSGAYLLFPLDQLMSYSGETASEFNYSEYIKEIEAFMNKETFSPETLNSLLKKYSALFIDNIDNMKLDKNVSITASNLKSTYNMLTSELNGEDVYNILTAVLKEAKNDKTLKELFVSLKVCKEEEYSQLIEDASTDLTNEKKSMTAADSILMRVYVDKTGKIMGREFTTQEEKNPSGGGYYLAAKGRKIGYTAWVKEKGVNIIEFNTDGTSTADGFSGTSVFNFSEYNPENDDYTTNSFNIASENVNLVKNKGYLNGKFTVTSGLLTGGSLVLNCTADEQQQDIVLQVIYGGLEAATLNITSKEGTYEDIEFPASSDQIFDGLTDVNSYLGTVDIEGFLTHANEVTGLDFSGLLNGFLSNSIY